MTTTGITTRPADQASCAFSNSFIPGGSNSSPIAFLESKLNENPGIRLKANSTLAFAVVQEYRSVSGATERPRWPEDLCGYIEDVEARVLKEAVRRAKLNLLVQGVPDTQYDQDECINSSIDGANAASVIDSDVFLGATVASGSSLPGSYAYGNCSENIDSQNPFEDLFTVDWTTYFENDVFPEVADVLEDLSEEDLELINIYYEQYGELYQQGLDQAQFDIANSGFFFNNETGRFEKLKRLCWSKISNR